MADLGDRALCLSQMVTQQQQLLLAQRQLQRGKPPLVPEKSSDLQPLLRALIDLRQLRQRQHRQRVLAECSYDPRF